MRPRVAVQGSVLVGAICLLVLLCYNQTFVARGVMWIAPVVVIAAAYPKRVVHARLNVWLLAFGGWLVFVSVLAGLPRGTFMLLLFCGTIAAGVGISSFGIDAVGRGLLAASALLVTLSVVACLAHWTRALESDPLYAGSWRGIFDQKNTLGFTAALLLVLCVAYFHQLPRNRVYALLAVGGLAMLGAHSVSAIGALFYALAVFALLETARRRGRTLRTHQVVALLVVVFVAFVAMLPHVLERFGRDPTLTGRTVVWSTLTKDARADITFGHGVNAYWFDASGQSSLDLLEQHLHFRPGQAHDGALDAILDGGLPELVLLVALVVAATRRAVFAYGNGCTWPLLVLSLGLMSTATERGLYSAPMLFVMAAIVSAPSLSAPAV